MVFRRRILALVLGSLPLVGCLCLVAAACAYPGGSWWDRQAEGASFLDTFLCDLMASRSLNGLPNPLGSRFAQVGMSLLTGALVPAWWLVGTAIRPPHRSWRIARGLGLAGLLPLAIALATPGRWLHAVAIPGAGLVELTALSLVTLPALRDGRHRSLGLLGLALMVLLLVGLAFYWPTLARGELAHRGLPAIQKVGVLAMTGWMLVIAHEAWKDRGE